MRLLFPHPGLLSFGNHEGGIKSFRAMIVALARVGHECEIISAPDVERGVSVSDWDALCSTSEGDGATRIAQTVTRPLPIAEVRAGRRVASFRQVSNLIMARKEFARVIARRISEWRPDRVIWENGLGSLSLALGLAGERLVVSVASAMALPFGPFGGAAWYASRSSVYRRLPRVICVSRFLRDYLASYGSVRAEFFPQLAYGRGPFPLVADINGPVVMVNPCLLKGGNIFAGLARHFPTRIFRGIVTYRPVVPELRTLPNVELRPSGDDMTSVLSGASAVLLPSQYGEAWGMVAVDAMLRGIPVIASDDGGVPESTLGVCPCISTERFTFGRGLLGPTIRSRPIFDLRGWCSTLASLLYDPDQWRHASNRARATALEYVSSLSVQPLAEYLSRS